MFKKLRDRIYKRRLDVRLKNDGELVETIFMLYVNNHEPMNFATRSALSQYLTNFRKENEIFKLQIFKVESYSL